MQAPSIPTKDNVAHAADHPGTFWQGALVGGTPIALVVVIVSATLLLASFARAQTASGGFFAQQQAALIVLVAGVALAAIGYIIAIIWAWRWMRRQHRAGAVAPTRGALVALAVTSLHMLLPLILAVALPPPAAPFP